jgi:adenylate kinase
MVCFRQVEEGTDFYVLVCPQNVVGNTILTNLQEMVEAAEAAGKATVLFNPILKDIPSSGGVMGTR